MESQVAWPSKGFGASFFTSDAQLYERSFLMRWFVAITIALFVFPMAVNGQVELGLDMGFTLQAFDEPEGFTGEIDNLNTIQIPVPAVRVGFSAGGIASVEALATLESVGDGDDRLTLIRLLPGVNVGLGEGGFYVRGEGGLVFLDDGNDSETQFALGVAAGIKRAIPGGANLRVEGGFDKWFEDADAGLLGTNEFRLLVGFGFVIG
jgi:hypothetical protein